MVQVKAKPTVREVALRADVSPATVSRVLSSTGRVAPELRERVHRAVAELGYRTNQVARSLATGRLGVVSLLVPDLRNPFFAEMARGVEDLLSPAGYALILANTDDTDALEQSHIERARELRTAGMIIASATDWLRLKHDLNGANCPVVLVNRYHPEAELDGVAVDNYRGGYLAGRHLVELGHRHIAHLGGPPRSPASSERLRGLRAALANAGLDPDGLTLEYGTLCMESGYEFGLRLGRTAPAVTAVFAANDLMAMGVLHALHERGLKVPEDLSVIGFDDTPLASLWSVQLSTVRQPRMEMGRQAAQLLLDRMRGDTSPFRRIVLLPELIIRGSTGAPRATAALSW